MNFVFIITGYNNLEWYKRNLESVFFQTYTNFRIIYIDDCSTDGTPEQISKYSKIQLFKNKERHYQTYNRWIAYNLCDDDEICVMLDADDWLIDKFVLDHLNRIYTEQDVLCTYGQFNLFYNNQISREVYSIRNYPDHIKQTNSYRDFDFIAYHLRTGYAKLFKAIPKEYLMINGVWLNRCSDLAEMFCVLELSQGKNINAGRSLYVYNKTNSMYYDRSPFLDKNRKIYESYIRNLKKLGGIK